MTPKPEVLGDGGHRGNQQDRVVDRHLGAGAQRGLVGALVYVVGAQHVGDEHAVEFALFQHLGQVGPVAQVVVGRGLSSGWRHSPDDWWTTQFMSKALKRISRLFSLIGVPLSM